MKTNNPYQLSINLSQLSDIVNVFKKDFPRGIIEGIVNEWDTKIFVWKGYPAKAKNTSDVGLNIPRGLEK
jgi:hypothetical protein